MAVWICSCYFLFNTLFRSYSPLSRFMCLNGSGWVIAIIMALNQLDSIYTYMYMCIHITYPTTHNYYTCTYTGPGWVHACSIRLAITLITQMYVRGWLAGFWHYSSMHVHIPHIGYWISRLPYEHNLVTRCSLVCTVIILLIVQLCNPSNKLLIEVHIIWTKGSREWDTNKNKKKFEYWKLSWSKLATDDPYTEHMWSP